MSGYRERRDPRDVAAELVSEAYEREARAFGEKSRAEAAVRIKEADREALWHRLGAENALERHLEALHRSLTELGVQVAQARAARGEADRAAIARIEAERAAFLTGRGVDPGPSLERPHEDLAASDVAQQLATARERSAGTQRAIREADAELAAARSALEAALDALAAATRARIDAQAELTRTLG